MTTRFVTAAFLFGFALTPMQALAQTAPANLYECTTNNNDVVVTYSTTSFTGDPRITIRLDRVVISRSGAEIQTQDTVLGSLVTVVRQQVPDSFIDTVTLVAPHVNLTGKTPSVAFSTELFLTRTRTTIGGPALVEGLIEQSSTRHLSCQASAVAF
jgi:hypothetical protein